MSSSNNGCMGCVQSLLKLTRSRSRSPSMSPPRSPSRSEGERVFEQTVVVDVEPKISEGIFSEKTPPDKLSLGKPSTSTGKNDEDDFAVNARNDFDAVNYAHCSTAPACPTDPRSGTESGTPVRSKSAGSSPNLKRTLSALSSPFRKIKLSSSAPAKPVRSHWLDSRFGKATAVGSLAADTGAIAVLSSTAHLRTGTVQAAARSGRKQREKRMRGSIHYVKATPVRYLASETGSIAILASTAGSCAIDNDLPIDADDDDLDRIPVGVRERLDSAPAERNGENEGRPAEAGRNSSTPVICGVQLKSGVLDHESMFEIMKPSTSGDRTHDSARPTTVVDESVTMPTNLTTDEVSPTLDSWLPKLPIFERCSPPKSRSLKKITSRRQSNEIDDDNVTIDDNDENHQDERENVKTLIQRICERAVENARMITGSGKKNERSNEQEMDPMSSIHMPESTSSHMALAAHESSWPPPPPISETEEENATAQGSFDLPDPPAEIQQMDTDSDKIEISDEDLIATGLNTDDEDTDAGTGEEEDFMKSASTSGGGDGSPGDGPRPETRASDGGADDRAATTIQAVYRGFRARKYVETANAAAVKIQAGFRGYRVRQSLKNAAPSTATTDDSHSWSDDDQKSVVSVSHGPVKGGVQPPDERPESRAADEDGSSGSSGERGEGGDGGRDVDGGDGGRVVDGGDGGRVVDGGDGGQVVDDGDDRGPVDDDDDDDMLSGDDEVFILDDDFQGLRLVPPPLLPRADERGVANGAVGAVGGAVVAVGSAAGAVGSAAGAVGGAVGDAGGAVGGDGDGGRVPTVAEMRAQARIRALEARQRLEDARRN